MTAPSTVTRSTPVGIKLGNGHSTKIAFAADTDISFWEVTVTPPGVDGGDSINITTMHNTTYDQKAPRTLKTLTDASISAAYDPVVYDQIVALINVETTITIIFPNNDKLNFYGYLKNFQPAVLAEGEFPLADLEIVTTNADPTTGEEEGPDYVTAAGTT